MDNEMVAVDRARVSIEMPPFPEMKELAARLDGRSGSALTVDELRLLCTASELVAMAALRFIRDGDQGHGETLGWAGGILMGFVKDAVNDRKVGATN